MIRSRRRLGVTQLNVLAAVLRLHEADEANEPHPPPQHLPTKSAAPITARPSQRAHHNAPRVCAHHSAWSSRVVPRPMSTPSYLSMAAFACETSSYSARPLLLGGMWRVGVRVRGEGKC